MAADIVILCVCLCADNCLCIACNALSLDTLQVNYSVCYATNSKGERERTRQKFTIQKRSAFTSWYLHLNTVCIWTLKWWVSKSTAICDWCFLITSGGLCCTEHHQYNLECREKERSLHRAAVKVSQNLYTHLDVNTIKCVIYIPSLSSSTRDTALPPVSRWCHSSAN